MSEPSEPSETRSEQPCRRAAGRWRIGAVGAAGLAVAALAAVGCLVALAPAQSKGLGSDLRTMLLGARFRITIRCPMADNRVSYFMRARSQDEASHALRWTLPVCELRWLTAQPPPGVEPASWPTTWYRGDFFCPANFHRRSLKVQAADLDRAVAEVRAGARECRVETADQTDCPLLRPGCTHAASDLREAVEREPIRANR